MIMTGDTRIALISGAGRETGIGFETANQLAQQGIKVILTAQDAATAVARANALAKQGLDVIGRSLDVTDEKSVHRIAAEIAEEFGRLDILVNNAALFGDMREHSSKADLATAHQVLEVKLFGAWRLTQALLPLLHKAKHPRIVNVSSGAGSHADLQFGLTLAAMGTSYPVANAALNALTVKFAAEEKPNGILINAVCPGFTATQEGMKAAGARPVSDGAAGIVWAALLPDSGPTGGFFRDGKALGW
jgi:NAD(P)-dependent dehydrogenase (short-subunit alcohol dehydrogenase family)